MAEWRPPDPHDLAYFEAKAKRNRVLAVIAVIIGVVALAFCIPALPRAMAKETPGVYVVGDVPDCRAKTHCLSRTGTFTSDDRKVIDKPVRMRDPLPTSVKQGHSVRAFDIGAVDVFTQTKRKGLEYEWPIAGTIVALLAIACGLHGFSQNRKPRKRKGPDAT